MKMTIQEANQIWHDCYCSDDETLWDRYTFDQRLDAIETMQLEHERINGTYSSWKVSDHH